LLEIRDRLAFLIAGNEVQHDFIDGGLTTGFCEAPAGTAGCWAGTGKVAIMAIAARVSE